MTGHLKITSGRGVAATPELGVDAKPVLVEGGSDVKAGREHRQPGRAVRDVTIAMIVAALVLLAFNSTGLRSWLRDLPGNRTTDTLVERADQWHALMKGAGFTLPKAAVQNAVAEFREADWSDVFRTDEVEARERPSKLDTQ